MNAARYARTRYPKNNSRQYKKHAVVTRAWNSLPTNTRTANTRTRSVITLSWWWWWRRRRSVSATFKGHERVTACVGKIVRGRSVVGCQYSYFLHWHHILHFARLGTQRRAKRSTVITLNIDHKHIIAQNTWKYDVRLRGRIGVRVEHVRSFITAHSNCVTSDNSRWLMNKNKFKNKWKNKTDKCFVLWKAIGGQRIQPHGAVA